MLVLLNHVKKMYKISRKRCLTIVLPKYCRTFVEIKMERLFLADRNRAIRLLQASTAKRHVARILNCSRVKIQKYWRRFQQGQSLDDLSRSGRPNVTTPNQDRYIRLMHARRLFTAATETARNTVGTHNRRISARQFGGDLPPTRCLLGDRIKDPFSQHVIVLIAKHGQTIVLVGPGSSGARCLLQMKVSSTCHLRTVISGFTDVGAKGSLSAVFWNIIDGVEEG